MSKNLFSNLKHILINPFEPNDVSCGCENEFQVAVEGHYDHVDLSDRIINSNYYKNLKRRVKAGDTPSRLLKDLEDILFSNNHIWENSWVRIEEDKLADYTKEVFRRDLLKDKENPSSGYRKDIKDFFFYRNGKTYIRIPVSYLLKIALVDFYSNYLNTRDSTTEQLITYIKKHFINDNTSPEVTSFYISEGVDNIGKDVAKENVKRFLFIQLLINYANHKLGLIEDNQKVYLYNSPLTPFKQKRLNSLIPDELYRELFISPCLSGWNKGEEKKIYMFLCHSILSKSKLNTLKKLKDGGFIKSNLVIMPDTSNTCLANNGTHISIGSKKLSQLLADNDPKFKDIHEKYYGDLAIKIIEHFLPLFPGVYSASPYRLSFKDMHPEVSTGFLAHELDFTFLRMIWRRWQKKAGLVRFNRVISPTGLDFLDAWIAKIFRMKGDYVLDYRLIDYFVSLMSTDNAPALNGEIDNQETLKEELESIGIFHKDMSFYSLYRLRNFSKYGFSGFEGRYYSNFANILDDLMHAVNLQIIITYLAYKYIITGEIVHNDIPDSPSTESERRQIFFCSAIGIPTFYVRIHTENNLLKKLLSYTKNSRLSKRYPGYIRVYLNEYLFALINVIENDARGLINQRFYKDSVEDCKERINNVVEKTHYKLSKNILNYFGKTNAVDIPADDFNQLLEKYYREDLRKHNIKEGIIAVLEDIEKIDFSLLPREITKNFDIESLRAQVNVLGKNLLNECIDINETIMFIKILLADFLSQLNKRNHTGSKDEPNYASSIY